MMSTPEESMDDAPYWNMSSPEILSECENIEDNPEAGRGSLALGVPYLAPEGRGGTMTPEGPGEGVT